MSNIDSDFLAELDSEAEYARKGNRPDRIKIEKGTGAVVRILPVQMGTKHLWFGRIGRHWYNKKMIGCPRATAASMGGAPDADCPVCQLSEELQASSDPVMSKAGGSIGVWPKYLTYALVLEWIDSRGDSEPVKMRDRYTPGALWLPRTAFTELDRLVKKSLHASPGLGLVDPVTGFDIEIRLDMKNNWRLELLGQQPIRDDMQPDALVAWTEELCASIKIEDTHPASFEELEKFANHTSAQLANIEAPRSGARGRYEDAAGDAPPPRRRDAAAPLRATPRQLPPPPRAVAPAAEPASSIEEELDAVPGAEAPPDENEAEAPPPPPPRARAVAPAPVRPAPRLAPAAPAPRAAIPAPAPARRAITPPPARRPAPPEAADEGDGDDVPPETHDAAPPVADDEAPPPVAASAPRPAAPRPVARPLSDALKKTLNKGI